MKHSKRDGFQNDPQAKKRRQFKSARIIVRNLPFSSTEESLKEYFSEFGKVAEVKLLCKGDGKLVGCGFIQFENKLHAASAIQKASGKPFKGRVIIADWAVPKDQFIKSQKEIVKSEIKKEPDDEVKQEILSDDEHHDVEVKNEVESVSDDSESDSKVVKSESESDDLNQDDDTEQDSDKEGKQSNKRKRSSSHSDEDSEDSDEDGEDFDEESENSDGDGDFDEEDDDSNEGSDDETKPDVSKIKKRKSNDVIEGKTVFIKNVPFVATEDELQKAVEQFGPIYYAKICVDPFTEHSKGTAFVKFKSKDSADKCLSSGTEFTLNGTVLDPHPALPKKEIINKRNQPKKPSDSRNLYLLKEGVITAGSKAAEGVSVSDMGKRLQIERWKREIIKDLGKFVSRYRLVIHNIPLYYDDKKTAILIKKYCPQSARFREVRVMRDLKNVDMKGVGKSKGFAFVTFEKHEDALATLRNMNNNPNVFKPQKRPIVSFSVESRKALKIKEARLEKSRQTKTTKTEPTVKIEKDIVKLEKPNKSKHKKENVSNVKDNKNKPIENEEVKEKATFSGAFATPGSKKFINNLSIKNQALIHLKELRKEKTKNKLNKKKLPRKIRKAIKMENMTRPKKINKEDKEFTSLVDKYRNQILRNENKKKWFE